MAGPSWCAVVVGLAGCGFSVTAQPGVAGTDAQVTADADGDAPFDGRVECQVTADLAHWPLAAVPIDDDTINGVDATSVGAVAVIPDGPCGPALEFGTAIEPAHVVIEDDNDWDKLRRISLWVRPTAAAFAGVLSRDGLDFQDGTFGLYEALTVEVTQRRMFAVRVQQRSPNKTEVVCAPRPPAGQWTHVEINLGNPVQLFVDGVLANDTTSMVMVHAPSPCVVSDIELRASPNPIVLGATNDQSTMGSTDNLSSPFAGGAVANLELHTMRR